MTDVIRRVFVEKKLPFALEAKAVLADLQQNLNINGLTNVRILNRYDVSGTSEQEFKIALTTIMSEPPVDDVYLDNFQDKDACTIFAVEYVPGQYDQRADCTEQCIKLIAKNQNIIVKTAIVFVLYGDLTALQIEKIKDYYINPVESRQAKLELPKDLNFEVHVPDKVKRIENFSQMDRVQLQDFALSIGLAMNIDDLLFCQEYFKKENKAPTITEIKVLDTYWSDHCRHTTFNTIIDNIDIVQHKYTIAVQEALDRYMQDRQEMYNTEDKPITLMDIAVLAMKKMRKEGKLNDLDVSEEVNACSINVKVDIDGEKQDWLVMFKNETHNHPTEIEPFGGAATCLGGAIRDPLSGRAYVYQAMRITGGADPLTAVDFTLKGKLPQRKIALGAAAGYSSYGNQIGLATGKVKEFYNEKFLAKRMEVGAVVGAVPKEYVVRAVPKKGDSIILLGGKTGRDGCGGATGSSKSHTVESLEYCGAEVQKGNAIIERKILRLFRNPDATRLIKRCNDFGAGGVCVAIGELADGVQITLDAVPKKYEGLDGTELAISESQERMALVVADKDCARFIALAEQENLQATVVAKVTDQNRMVMTWQGDTIVDIDRDFLNTNGVRQYTQALVKPPEGEFYTYIVPMNVLSEFPDAKKMWLENLKRLETSSQKGLVERFDSTIGRASVVMPFGGKNQLTPADGMVACIPALSDKVNTATVMTYGYNPDFANWSPFYGAFYAVIESICSAVVLGADPKTIRLSFQEYFEKMVDAQSWGKPLSALLGAYIAQIGLDTPAIGGKDSMSGTFMDINVPPTLISFALGIADKNNVVTNEFKKPGSKVVFLNCEQDDNDLVKLDCLKEMLNTIHKAIVDKKIISASIIREGGIARAISVMCFGNDIGFEFNKKLKDLKNLFFIQPASFILELADGVNPDELFENLQWMLLGVTNNKEKITLNDQDIDLLEAKMTWNRLLEEVYPTVKQISREAVTRYSFEQKTLPKANVKIAKPKVFIPVFPGTNCEYDVMRAFKAAGADTEIFVIKNNNSEEVLQSVKYMAQAIQKSQILSLVGGFSLADEPEGSGKFITTMFRNPYLKEAVSNFMQTTDGLIIGICNGFQALIKLGLLPYGKVQDLDENSPTLAFNAIGRHVSTICQTKVVSNLSPWLCLEQVGNIHSVALSSGEGRFYANQENLDILFKNGQVASQYVDFAGNPTMQSPFNPNGSVMAIESITSPDGRILGKMCHSERWTDGLMKNIVGNKDYKIFQSGVHYFS